MKPRSVYCCLSVVLVLALGTCPWLAAGTLANPSGVGITVTTGLDDDGVTPVNYPRITSVSTNGITPTITGTACANCALYLYAAIGNPAAPGGGGLLLDSTVANGAGQWSIAASPTITTLVPFLAPSSFSAYVIDASASTYEMSPRPLLWLPLIKR